MRTPRARHTHGTRPPPVPHAPYAYAAAASNIYKEIGLKGAELDIWYANAWIGMFQLAFGILTVWTVNMKEFMAPHKPVRALRAGPPPVTVDALLITAPRRRCPGPTSGATSATPTTASGATR